MNAGSSSGAEREFFRSRKRQGPLLWMLPLQILHKPRDFNLNVCKQTILTDTATHWQCQVLVIPVASQTQRSWVWIPLGHICLRSYVFFTLQREHIMGPVCLSRFSYGVGNLYGRWFISAQQWDRKPTVKTHCYATMGTSLFNDVAQQWPGPHECKNDLCDMAWRTSL
jgi:hypothetical protein